MTAASQTSVQHRFERALIVAIVPYILITLGFVLIGSGDVDLTLDSEGIPIVTQSASFFVYAVLWMIANSMVFGVAYGLVSLVAFIHPRSIG